MEFIYAFNLLCKTFYSGDKKTLVRGGHTTKNKLNISLNREELKMGNWGCCSSISPYRSNCYIICCSKNDSQNIEPSIETIQNIMIRWNHCTVHIYSIVYSLNALVFLSIFLSVFWVRCFVCYKLYKLCPWSVCSVQRFHIQVVAKLLQLP